MVKARPADMIQGFEITEFQRRGHLLASVKQKCNTPLRFEKGSLVSYTDLKVAVPQQRRNAQISNDGRR